MEAGGQLEGVNATAGAPNGGLATIPGREIVLFDGPLSCFLGGWHRTSFAAHPIRPSLDGLGGLFEEFAEFIPAQGLVWFFAWHVSLLAQFQKLSIPVSPLSVRGPGRKLAREEPWGARP